MEEQDYSLRWIDRNGGLREGHGIRHMVNVSRPYEKEGFWAVKHYRAGKNSFERIQVAMAPNLRLAKIMAVGFMRESLSDEDKEEAVDTHE